MEYILFVVYLILFAWLVTKLKFYTNTGLSNSQLIILFLLKIMAGIFYGWIGVYYGGLAQMSDTWSYHANSVNEYRLLLHDPKEYLVNLFRNPYEGGFSKFFDTTDSYWNDLKGNVFIKILSVFDILSFGNYYINVIFYSFITLSGPVALFRVMSDVFKTSKNNLLISTFLVPSFLYWTSGLHKEGLIFTGISLVIYVIYFSTKEKKINLLRVIGLITGLLLILTLRNFIIVILVPALIAWLLAIKWPRFSLRLFLSLYILYSILFFSLRYLNPKLDFPQAVVNKQQEFISLVGGTSTIPITELKPTVVSFIKNTPQAINLSVVRPYPSDVHHILSLVAAIEINSLLLIFIIFLFFRIRNGTQRPVIYFFLFFSFSLLMAIGFSNNNLGAIVRYRSIIFPLLVVPMVAQINWDRVFQGKFNFIK
ncbi:MAG TPA: hypothetical protein PKC72_08650, partial [Chitinophagaceae bacterium]|nr:hypothetical protein [Chitinophagaceae bacterium]